jgi:hypothetical protein
MKLVPLTNENPTRKMKMIITETQFRALANNVLPVPGGPYNKTPLG